MTVLITAREHGPVDLSRAPDPVRARGGLLAATQHLREPVFRVDRRGRLFALGFVGMVHAGAVTVEILPKVTSGSRADDAMFVLRLLVAAGLVPYRLVSRGLVSNSKIPLLEIVMRDAAEQFRDLLGEHGPPRRYEIVRDELPTVRGRIDMTRAMRQMPPERHRLPLVHAPFQVDNPLSRELLALATVLKSATRSRRTASLLDDAIVRLGVASGLALSDAVSSAAVPSVDEGHWGPLHELAVALASSTSPNQASPGVVSTRVLLFSLDDVFERVLRRAIPRALVGTGIDLAPTTPGLHFLIDETTGRPRLRLRPDLLLTEQPRSRPVVVADAKWKTLSSTPSGPILNRQDVYQVSAYLNRYRLPVGVVLVPADEASWSPAAEPYRVFRVEGSDTLLSVMRVDVPGLVSSAPSDRETALAHLRDGLMVHVSLSRSRAGAPGVVPAAVGQP